MYNGNIMCVYHMYEECVYVISSTILMLCKYMLKKISSLLLLMMNINNVMGAAIN